MSKLDKRQVKDVLDLGCGVGRHTLCLAEAGFNVTAVDSSSEALTVLNKQLKDKRLVVRVINEDYSADMFAPDSFDCILAYNVIYHGTRDTVLKALRLIYKWLKPGGILFFTFPSKHDGKFGSGEKVAINTYRPLNSVHPGDVHYFADEIDLLDLLQGYTLLSKRVEEHTWDNNGVKQFSSYWHILVRKLNPITGGLS